jgi:uncharacterized protein
MIKAIDMQTCTSTKKGALFKDPVLLADLAAYFHSPDQAYKTDEEMIKDFRDTGVKVVFFIANYGFFGWKDWGEIKERHDYFGHLKKTYPDIILGAWLGLDPQSGAQGIRELERCIKDLGSFGICAAGAVTGVPANDKSYFPFYEKCNEAKVPVKIMVGAIAAGAGQPGGRGIRLWTENPIPYLDDVAAQFPELIIVGHHAPWPFHHEMIAVLVHKGNVYNELHGWSPKYFPTRLKMEINGRIQDKVMFGSDYPLFSYERLFRDWESENYKPEVLEKIYYKNAQRILGLKL